MSIWVSTGADMDMDLSIGADLGGWVGVDLGID